MTHHNTEFKYYTCSLFFICNTKVSRTRSALWVVLCNVYCTLASVLIRVHPLKFPSLPIPLPPTLLPVHPPPSVAPSFLRSLPQSPLSFAPSIPSSVPFIDSSLPPLAPSLPHPLAPSHPPSFLALSLPPSMHACLPPSNSMSTVCVCFASCTVLCSA